MKKGTFVKVRKNGKWSYGMVDGEIISTILVQRGKDGSPTYTSFLAKRNDVQELTDQHEIEKARKESKEYYEYMRNSSTWRLNHIDELLEQMLTKLHQKPTKPTAERRDAEIKRLNETIAKLQAWIDELRSK